MKILTSFAAGVLALAAVVFFANGTGAPMFAAGVIVAICPAAVVFSSAARIRNAARFMNAFADAWQGKQPAAASSAPPPPSPVIEQVTLALIGLGAKKTEAAEAAAAAGAHNLNFDDTFRIALDSLRPARRVIQ